MDNAEDFEDALDKIKSKYPDYGDNAPLLLKRADEALYASKNKGRDCYQFFSQNIERLPA
ncbi:MAG: hypothetical protein QGG38_07355 [Nitrospinaceae bacterium]|jgi:GGDEF domain-containing protein|nr:hypothetical protein [Nitrospinaceae bacterium]MDP6712486.1 hypothetical protein [Nitrospinaceae bacterium]HAK37781.1 hypothetical protein [Nitrospina sp.]